MSEVLSQSQIDALLSAARSGENIESPEDTSKEKKYRKYDFRSPRKFTKDRLKMLDSIFENYSRNLNSRVNALMHTSCEISVESAEEQRYYEFSNALIEGDVVTLAYVKYGDVREDTPALLHVSKSLMLSMIDRMMGGEGEVDDDLDPEYTFTDLELKIVEGLSQYFVENLGESWQNYIQLDFEYSRVEPNPTMIQPLGLDEIVVIMDLTVKFPNCDGHMSICLPGMVLTNIFSEISRLNTTHKNQDETSGKEIFESLKNTEIDLVAEICRTKLKLSDIYHLNVGDVIDLKRPKNSPVYINIGGRRWFDGMMGVHNKNMAVKIGKTYYEPEGRNVERDGR
ncbi:Flagellar motor switch protein FliM [bioreactor metagenome]|uniref:Flagellar motor switch protein FliM n=1 Tax=bioreactor metagenome TaxID=1076179 RepID=A0A644XUF2_9ZZZZ